MHYTICVKKIEMFSYCNVAVPLIKYKKIQNLNVSQKLKRFTKTQTTTMTDFHTDANSLWSKMIRDGSAYSIYNWTHEEKLLTIQAVVDDCKHYHVCKTKIFIEHDGYTRGEPDSDLLTLVVWAENNNNFVLRVYKAEYWWAYEGYSATDTMYERCPDPVTLEITANTTLRWYYSMEHLTPDDDFTPPLDRTLLHTLDQIKSYLTSESSCQLLEPFPEDAGYIIADAETEYYSDHDEYSDVDETNYPDFADSFPSFENDITIEEACRFLPPPPVLVRQRAVILDDIIARNAQLRLNGFEPMNL